MPEIKVFQHPFYKLLTGISNIKTEEKAAGQKANACFFRSQR